VYRVSAQDLAELNNIEDGSGIPPGTKLYLPPRPKGRAWKKLPQREKDRIYDAPIEIDRSIFIWPLDGKVFSGFGIRNGRRHDGIDISAASGTPIRASAGGQAVFSGRLSGYGNMVIVKHANNFFSIYAHNSRNSLKKGEKVKQGDVIAYVGSTGRASGPHCHFEIRHRQKARNPLFFLPVKK
jgi:murein DD-endopeptidase MepM/ murein hydrolase activator NlpD